MEEKFVINTKFLENFFSPTLFSSAINWKKIIKKMAYNCVYTDAPIISPSTLILMIGPRQEFFSKF